MTHLNILNTGSKPMFIERSTALDALDPFITFRRMGQKGGQTEESTIDSED